MKRLPQSKMVLRKEENTTSFTASFEVYAAIGGDPDVDQVYELFTNASKEVLNISDDDERTKTRSGRSRRRASMQTSQKRLTTTVRVIDCEEMDLYFGSEDGIRCFSIVVSIVVTSNSADLDSVSTTAENLKLAAELALSNGEFDEIVKSIDGPIELLLMEMAPESTSDETADYNNSADDYDDPESSIDLFDSNDDDGDDHSDSSSLSSMNSEDFDDFLEMSYREYLEDQNRQEIRQEILAKVSPESPSTVTDFPSEYSKTRTLGINPPYAKSDQLKPRTGLKVKFDPVVRVQNTISRYDMTPNESYNYWNGREEFMTIEQRDRMLKTLTDEWIHRKEEESRQQTQNFNEFQTKIHRRGSVEMVRSLNIPMLPAIKQLLPATEPEEHDRYTYTISIRD